MSTVCDMTMGSKVQRKLTRCLLRVGDVRASVDGFEVVGVFNPGVSELRGKVHLLVRVAEAPVQDREGFVGLPRADLAGGYEVDWYREDEVRFDDPRIVTVLATGRKRLTFVSHLRLAISEDGRHVDWVDDGVCFGAEQKWEAFGVEDARVTRIDDKYWITYVGVSEHGISTGLASTEDFRSYDRHGIVFPTENKDVVLFPERLSDGRYAALHRPFGNAPLGSREIWTARSPDLFHWGGHGLVVRDGDLDGCRWVGAGAPPVRVDEGWLVIYHGVTKRSGGGVGSYHARGMILDADEPGRVLWQGGGALLEPEEAIERTGFLSDVLFVSGAVERGGDLYLYYGAGDSSTAVTVVDTREVVEKIKAGLAG